MLEGYTSKWQAVVEPTMGQGSLQKVNYVSVVVIRSKTQGFGYLKWGSWDTKRGNSFGDRLEAVTQSTKCACEQVLLSMTGTGV